jgi:hypothetical protein
MTHLSALNIVHPSHQFIQPVEQTIQQQKKNQVTGAQNCDELLPAFII